MKPKHAYIRPVHPKGGGKILSLALCRRDDILVDADVISHFPANASGKDIKEMAVEYGHADCIEHVHWSSPIFA